MTRDEIRADLDGLGVTYPKSGKGSGKQDLLALLESCAVIDVGTTEFPQSYWFPDWLLASKAQVLPMGCGPGGVCKSTLPRPKSPPPSGGT